MSWILQIFLNIKGTITKSFGRFQSSRLKFLSKAYRVVGYSHSATTTSCNSFYNNRETNFLSNLNRIFFILNRTIASGNNGHTRFADRFTGHCFVPHFTNSLSFRTYEIDIA